MNFNSTAFRIHISFIPYKRISINRTSANNFISFPVSFVEKDKKDLYESRIEINFDNEYIDSEIITQMVFMNPDFVKDKIYSGCKIYVFGGINWIGEAIVLDVLDNRNNV